MVIFVIVFNIKVLFVVIFFLFCIFLGDVISWKIRKLIIEFENVIFCVSVMLYFE